LFVVCIFGLNNKFIKFIKTWSKSKGLLDWHIKETQKLNPGCFLKKQIKNVLLFTLMFEANLINKIWKVLGANLEIKNRTLI
jgi:hypothetical protein